MLLPYLDAFTCANKMPEKMSIFAEQADFVSAVDSLSDQVVPLRSSFSAWQLRCGSRNRFLPATGPFIAGTELALRVLVREPDRQRWTGGLR